MGIFDDTEVYVDVIATKLTDTKATPIKNGVVSAVMRDSGTTDGILAGMINGLAPRARRYYTFAEKGKYIDGLPTVEIGKEFNDKGQTPGEYSSFPGSFYPIVNFRSNKEFLTKESDEERHKSTKRLLKRIAINVDDLVDTISTDNDADPPEPNPDVENLEDVYCLFGLDLYTNVEKSAEYMFDFWEYIKDDVVIDQFDHDANIALFEGGTIYTIPANAIRFTEPRGNYEMRLQFDYMFYAEFPGQLTDAEDKPIDARIAIIDGGFTQYESDIGDGGGGYHSYYIDDSAVIYWKQINETTHAAWTVYGLHHETHVTAYDESNRVIRTIAELPGAPTGTYDRFYGLVPGDADFGRSGFYFPLCKEVLELQHTIQEEVVLSDALTLIMHAAQEVDLDWYQQGWFKVVMVIVVAVIIYLSVGTLMKEGLTFLEFAMELATQYAIAYVLELVFKQVDGELALILATAVALYGASKGKLSNIELAFPHAKEVLQATKAIIQVSKSKFSSDVAELNSQQLELTERVEEFNAEMKEAYDYLQDHQNKFDPVWLDREPRVTMGDETPSMFYARTKTTNVAPLVKQSVSTYHSRALELPSGLAKTNKEPV